MSDNPNAEIVAIGTEILLGEITDTNSVFMARELRDIGVNVYYMTTVGDNLQRISDAIDLALSRADIVITCGGLGPTVDDMTRQGVANATHRNLVFDASLFDMIQERFRSFGSTMTENNRQQAYLPENAKIIENPVGTAPSFIVESERGVVISLPGVPREMKYLFNSAVLPYLLESYSLGTIVARVLKTAGIGESSLDDMIGKDLLIQSNPTIGLAAHHGSVDVRITAKADSKAVAEGMIDRMQAEVMAKIGMYVYGTGDARLEDVVASELSRHNQTIHLIEAGLAGAITDKLPAELYSSHIVDHPQTIYDLYDIDSGVSLKDAALSVASKALEATEQDAVIVLLSYPDIDENADVEAGSVLLILSRQLDSPRFRVYGFGAQSNLARDWMPRWGLSTLWRMLKEIHDDVD